MTDLHKALTALCDLYEPQRRTVAITRLRALLAEHPPTAPHPREPMLGGPDGADQAAMMERGRRLASERDDLIATGVDPAELAVPLAPPTAPVDREALAKVIEDAWQRGDSDVDAIIAYLDGGEAGQPRCQHVSPSPWGPTQCALPDHHDGRHAYSPSESIADGGEGS